MKTYTYKVYDSSGNYLDDLKDVVDDPIFSQEINTAGSEMTIRLARKPDDFDEGNTVAFNNLVKIYVSDDTADAEVLFQGRIVAYAPEFSDDEGLVITLYSLGYELNDYMYTAVGGTEQSQTTGSNEYGMISTVSLAQSFIPDQTTITDVDLKLRVTIATNLTLSIQADSSGTPSGTAITNGTAVKTVTDSTATVTRFTFSDTPTVTAGNTYWLVLDS